MTKAETATCQDCGWQGPVEETKEFRNVWDRVLAGRRHAGRRVPRGRLRRRGQCWIRIAQRRTISVPRWSRSCSVSTGCARTSATAYRALRSNPSTSRSLPTTPAGRWRPGRSCSPRLQCLRRHERPGGRLGELGTSTAQRWELHSALRGSRHLRGLRHRVQLHDEARHGGRVMPARSAFDFGGNADRPPVGADEDRQARMAAHPGPLPGPRAPPRRLRMAPRRRRAHPPHVPPAAPTGSTAPPGCATGTGPPTTTTTESGAACRARCAPCGDRCPWAQHARDPPRLKLAPERGTPAPRLHGPRSSPARVAS